MARSVPKRPAGDFLACKNRKNQGDGRVFKSNYDGIFVNPAVAQVSGPLAQPFALSLCLLCLYTQISRAYNII